MDTSLLITLVLIALLLLASGTLMIFLIRGRRAYRRRLREFVQKSSGRGKGE
jgi:hypothetical protein